MTVYKYDNKALAPTIICLLVQSIHQVQFAQSAARKLVHLIAVTPNLV